MGIPIQTLVVNKPSGKKHRIGPLDGQIRLVDPDGTAFTAGTPVMPTQEPEETLAAGADLETVTAKVNAILDKLKAAGILG